MDHFQVRDGEVYCEGVPLARIARELGTPTYVYSLATLQQQGQRILTAFQKYPTLACYAVKANSNLTILREIFAMGLGADIVSIGELERAIKAGAHPEHIIYSGVGKRPDEIDRALHHQILAFNVESNEELQMIAERAAARQQVASVSLRVNPNIDAKTNPKISTGLYSSKFGVSESDARQMSEWMRGHQTLRLTGLSCHIGSQILEIQPMFEAAQRLAALAQEFQSLGHRLEFLDVGGGLGIRYKEGRPPEPETYAEALLSAVKPTGLRLLIEPGRVIVGNTGVLLCIVLGRKSSPSKQFAIVDGAMNDLIRPSMYDSFHQICVVRDRGGKCDVMDVVGPICETSDYFGKDRELPRDLQAGDLVFLRGAGAYGSTMASNYNSRPRAAEVLVTGDSYRVIRHRERIEDLWQGEE